MPTTTLDQHIEVTPEVCGGRPRLAGRRITVQHIAVQHERLGRSVDEIASEHDLTLADVYAALAYYHDHRAEVDAAIRADDELVKALRQEGSSKLLEKLHGRRD